MSKVKIALAEKQKEIDMLPKLITNNEFNLLSETDQYFSYAHAYLDAASILCHKLTEEDKDLLMWSSATVIIFLTAHAVELFLKAAIICRQPDQQKRSHGLNELAELYNSIYHQPEFDWNVPLKTEFPDGMTEKEIKDSKLKEIIHSIHYRFPDSNKHGAGESFAPVAFLDILDHLKSDFVRIRAIIDKSPLEST